MSVAAVVAAAGRGERLGAGGPKALLALGGEPMLVHAVRALGAARSVDLVVVAAPPDQVQATREVLDAAELTVKVEVIAGGSTRSESVHAALDALGRDVVAVLVHDAARPLAPVALVEAVVAAVLEGAAAVVPVVPLADTVKEVEDDRVVRTVDRSRLMAVQTPQGFRREVIEAAHAGRAGGGLDATDDAGLVETMGHPVRVVPGHPDAFKVTGPTDLLLAEIVLSRREAADES